MNILDWLLAPEPTGGTSRGHLVPRWLFLRSLGLIFFSAFYALLFQIDGLIGPSGLLPANGYLASVGRALGLRRFWFAPTLFWFGSSRSALLTVCWIGCIAAALVVLNVWPRLTVFVCELCFLSFVTAAQDFSNYQSDGMLLAAGFLSLFFAPAGLRPGLGTGSAPSRFSLFSLQWLWFQIYFESGVVKLASGDPQWRHLTALDHYYENGPLPTWVGWYVQHLPHAFHASLALATLIIELGIVWLLFVPRLRVLCFWIVTPLQIGIILTANYCFLNYLVLALGFLLLDDRYLCALLAWLQPKSDIVQRATVYLARRRSETPALEPTATRFSIAFQRSKRISGMVVSGLFLGWDFYVATALLLFTLFPHSPLPVAPIRALEPFRIANQYGLFAVMTTARYEIEFQGSNDGSHWTAYPFRYKPQDVYERPGIYAPYQPRFDWNLWFASLGSWRDSPFVIYTAEQLLVNDQSVLSLFRSNPFSARPPQQLRTVMWRYWFTDMATLRHEHRWWNREFLGLYAPTLTRTPDGKYSVLEWPTQR